MHFPYSLLKWLILTWMDDWRDFEDCLFYIQMLYLQFSGILNIILIEKKDLLNGSKVVSKSQYGFSKF